MPGCTSPRGRQPRSQPQRLCAGWRTGAPLRGRRAARQCRRQATKRCVEPPRIERASDGTGPRSLLGRTAQHSYPRAPRDGWLTAPTRRSRPGRRLRRFSRSGVQERSRARSVEVPRVQPCSGWPVPGDATMPGMGVVRVGGAVVARAADGLSVEARCKLMAEEPMTSRRR